LDKEKILGIIYKVTNRINGKSYIGQTVKPLSERISEHVCHALLKKDNTYFHNAIRKYGKENFEWKIIVECSSLEKLNTVEIEMIKKHDTFESGYNLNLGGGSNIGFKHTEEAKKRISESRMGEKNPNYGKYGEKNHNFGKTRSKESKKKMSEAHMGEKNHNYGKHPTEETKRKISESHMGEKNPMYGRQGSESPKAKKYMIITPEGEEIFIHGIRRFCKDYEEEKLDCRHLIDVARGKRNHHKGYKCEYFIKE
jgi:hypothetical protein